VNAPAILAFMLAGFFGCGAMISFSRWIDRLPQIATGKVKVYTVPGLPFTFDYRGYVTGLTGRRANYIPRAGQVWKSSDPRRLSAFRIVSVDHAVDCAYTELITNPGAIGRTARTIALARFQVLGPKGYTRVA
jgi:hypothetical protein